MFAEIERQTHGRIDEQLAMQDLMDYMFERYTVKYFEIQFMIYFLGYFLPLIYQIHSYSILAVISCITVQALLLYNEVI